MDISRMKKPAVKVAVAILVPIYGEDVIAKEQPFRATLDKRKGIWTVEGTLEGEMSGGVAHVQIRKSDGMIVNVWHEL